jgi:hypothetical protein
MSENANAGPTTHDSSDGFRAFSRRLAPLSGGDSVAVALGILCWRDSQNVGIEMSVWEIAKLMSTYGLGNPNRTSLEARLSKSPLTLRGSKGFRLRVGAQNAIRRNLPGAFEPEIPEVNLETGYLPLQVWNNTRGYFEKVCKQLNGSYQFGFYDGALVMIRRAAETLIIEAYEYLQKESEIKDADGNYFMLGELVNRSSAAGGLTLGREAKAALKEIKKLGDRSAHNRRYNAVKADLEDIRGGVRVVVDELVNIASLRRA